MKRFVKGAIAVLVALALVFMGGAYVLPDEVILERQATINAPVEKVWPVVSSLKRFPEFSPWAELDPNMKVSFEGPETGVGQKMNWSSENPEVGSGSQTITALVEKQHVATALDFGDFGKAQASFDLSPAGQGTAVTWGFKTQLRNPLERWVGLLYDRWIGPDYERGLAKLKALAEKEASP